LFFSSPIFTVLIETVYANLANLAKLSFRALLSISTSIPLPLYLPSRHPDLG
jgi:hypothetical protein